MEKYNLQCGRDGSGAVTLVVDSGKAFESSMGKVIRTSVAGRPSSMTSNSSCGGRTTMLVLKAVPEVVGRLEDGIR